MKMTRFFTSIAIAATLLALAAGCAKKNDQAAGTSVGDSLLSTNPIEQPQGQIQPGQMPADTTPPAQATPTPAPARKPAPAKKPSGGTSHAPAPAPTTTVAAGTPLKMTFDALVSSETAHEGDAWSATLKEAVTVGSAAPFPAGSVVHGVIAGVRPAEKGDRAFLLLRVTSIDANGTSHEISASGDSMIAGSTRARNLGAIGGGAAVGALLGKAIGGSNKGAIIGGIIGGAAATGAVAKSKGFQVEVPKGQEMIFKVDTDTRIKL